jgi:hypothetical protein
MKHGTFFLLLIGSACLLVFSCEKENKETEMPPTEPSLDRQVDEIWLNPYKFGAGYDTAKNYIAHYTFRLNHTTLASYIATTSDRDQKYYIKYVGADDVPLLHPDSLIRNNGEAMDFPINSLLKGRPLFEVYTLADNKLVRRINAADSCKIMASFSVWANMSITPGQIRSAFDYYLTVKQTPAIKYYSVP